MEKYHLVVRKIINLLKNNSMWFETFEHEEVKTSEEAAKVRTGYTLHQGAKAIIIRVKNNETDKRFVMLVFPADLRFDNKKIKSLLNVKDIRFATEEEVEEITEGIKPGGVPPMGQLFDLEVLADETLFTLEKIIFNAGDRRFSIAMNAEDYKRLVNPKIVSFTI